MNSPAAGPHGPLSPSLSPSAGEREKPRRGLGQSLIQRQWGQGAGHVNRVIASKFGAVSGCPAAKQRGKAACIQPVGGLPLF
jgi:hypothetical protein